MIGDGFARLSTSYLPFLRAIFKLYIYYKENNYAKYINNYAKYTQRFTMA